MVLPTVIHHVLKHGGVDVLYHYIMHREMPDDVTDFIPSTWDEVLVPTLISASPALPAALSIVIPELFGGVNPLLGPTGVFVTPTATAMGAYMGLAVGTYFISKELSQMESSHQNFDLLQQIGSNLNLGGGL